MSVAIIIPARIGSTRLPSKPLAKIHGKTMIEHVLIRAKAANVGDVFVATDSTDIVEACKSSGGECILTDSSLQSGTDRVHQAAQKIDPRGTKYQYIINVQGDVPNIAPDVISNTFELLKLLPQAQITTPVYKLPDHSTADKPSVVKPVLSFANPVHNYAKALYFSRSKVPYGPGDIYEHIGVYAFKRQSLSDFVALPQSALEKRESLEQLRALEAGMQIFAAVVSSKPISVDIPQDLAEAIELMK